MSAGGAGSFNSLARNQTGKAPQAIDVESCSALLWQHHSDKVGPYQDRETSPAGILYSADGRRSV